MIPDLVPARMLNEYVYCPRPFYLEWVQGEWVDNADTEDGRFKHRRVDNVSGSLPASDEGVGVEQIHARSLLLSSERLGLIARLDLLEGAGDQVTPVDYKRGGIPDIPERAWEPDRVQVCAQALILRDNHYRCDEGFLYYVESRTRVRVEMSTELIQRTEELLSEARDTAIASAIPPPLVDSPRCPRCSLVGICLPDETRHLAAGASSGSEPRRLVPARDDALPVYVQAQGMSVGKAGDRIEVKERGKVVQDVRLLDVSQLCVFGNVQVSTQLIQELCDRDIPICYFTYGGWFYGVTQGMGHKNVELRRLQYRASEDPLRSVTLSARLVEAKIRNCRTLLRRNVPDIPDESLQTLADLAHEVGQVSAPSTLLGLEGLAAKIYFSHFGAMIRPKGEATGISFDFQGRNRRPPRDPVNALLSFAYSMLAKDFTVTLQAVGYDPYLGFYHTPRYGRPALALDLMEEFRPIIADSVVLSVINNGQITSGDFIARGGAFALTPPGRKTFLAAYGRRMDTLITHPFFGYTISYRRVLEVQARLLARYLTGEIPNYPQFLTR